MVDIHCTYIMADGNVQAPTRMYQMRYPQRVILLVQSFINICEIGCFQIIEEYIQMSTIT